MCSRSELSIRGSGRFLEPVLQRCHTVANSEKARETAANLTLENFKMSAVIETCKTTPTTQRLSDNDRTKFLRKVLREDGWYLYARSDSDWVITFRKTIKGDVGEPNVDVTVVLEDKVSICGKWGSVKSFEDSNEVYIPAPTRVHLSYGAVRTVAKFLLEGCHLSIYGSSGSTSSSKHGLSFVSLQCSVKGHCDTVVIGSESTYINGKIVCCGAVE